MPNPRPLVAESPLRRAAVRTATLAEFHLQQVLLAGLRPTAPAAADLLLSELTEHGAFTAETTSVPDPVPLKWRGPAGRKGQG